MKPRFKVIELFFLLVLIASAYVFAVQLSPYWFNPRWTTDDATQQLFPFHVVNQPNIFATDLIYQLMRGYLPPLHYLLGYLITISTKDPIMTGHWLMLLQVTISLLCLYLAVHKVAGILPACFSLIWLLHSYTIMERMVGGLPRGWGVPLICAYFFLVTASKWKLVFVLLILGVLLNPPFTFLLIVASALLLLSQIVLNQEFNSNKSRLLFLCLLLPIIYLLANIVISRPIEIGQMVSYQRAITMPEFAKQGGRFAFLPFDSPVSEIVSFATRVFVGKKPDLEVILVQLAPILMLVFTGAFILILAWKKQAIVPLEFSTFGLAALSCYLLARFFAFQLYVPDRYINVPLGLFLIASISIALQRLSLLVTVKNDKLILASFYTLLGSYVFLASASNLHDYKYFNFNINKYGRYPIWLAKHTAANSLIAGHPNVVDPVPLVAKRRVFVASELWHPFYEGYNNEMKRRIEVSLKAHYSASLSDLLALLINEGVDYFVFQRKLFYPNELAKASYFEPFNQVIHRQLNVNQGQLAFKQLPEYAVPYRDDQVLILDVQALIRGAAGERLLDQ